MQKCKSKAVLIDHPAASAEKKYILSKWKTAGSDVDDPSPSALDDGHDHPVDRSKEIARLMKKEMVAKMKDDPSKLPDQVRGEVIRDYEEKYKDDLELWDDVVANMGQKTSTHETFEEIELLLLARKLTIEMTLSLKSSLKMCLVVIRLLHWIPTKIYQMTGKISLMTGRKKNTQDP